MTDALRRTTRAGTSPSSPRPCDQLNARWSGRRFRLGATSHSAWRAPSSRSAGSRLSTRSRTRSATSTRRGPRGLRPRRVRDLIGDDAAQDLDALDELAGDSSRPGYLGRQGDRLELTPRGSRRIGQKVLDDLFAEAATGRVRWATAWTEPDGAGEREETTKPLRVRRCRSTSTQADAANALTREENAPQRRWPGSARPRLDAADFEVYRTEQLTQTSTVLLVDMSRSMLLRGCSLRRRRSRSRSTR